MILVHPGHTGTGAVADPDGPGPLPVFIEHEQAELVVGAILEALEEAEIPSAQPMGTTSGARRENCREVGGFSVEVHFNAGEGYYTAVFYRQGSRDGSLLARALGVALQPILPWRVRVYPDSWSGFERVQQALSWTIPGSSPPGILVECGFLDNAKHMDWFSQAGNRRNFALAVAKGFRTMEPL